MSIREFGGWCLMRTALIVVCAVFKLVWLPIAIHSAWVAFFLFLCCGLAIMDPAKIKNDVFLGVRRVEFALRLESAGEQFGFLVYVSAFAFVSAERRQEMDRRKEGVHPDKFVEIDESCFPYRPQLNDGEWLSATDCGHTVSIHSDDTGSGTVDFLATTKTKFSKVITSRSAPPPQYDRLKSEFVILRPGETLTADGPATYLVWSRHDHDAVLVMVLRDRSTVLVQLRGRSPAKTRPVVPRRRPSRGGGLVPC